MLYIRVYAKEVDNFVFEFYKNNVSDFAAVGINGLG